MKELVSTFRGVKIYGRVFARKIFVIDIWSGPKCGSDLESTSDTYLLFLFLTLNLSFFAGLVLE